MQPTPEQTALANRFADLVYRGRDTISALVAAINILAKIEEFRRLMVSTGQMASGFLAPALTPDDRARPEEILQRWNALEHGLSELQLRNFTARFGQSDFDIIQPQQPDQELDGWFLIAAAIGGAAYVTYAISSAMKTESEAKSASIEYKNRVLTIEKQIAKASPQVKRSWESFKSQNDIQQKKSLIDRLLGPGSMGLGIGALIIGGVLLLGMSRR